MYQLSYITVGTNFINLIKFSNVQQQMSYVYPQSTTWWYVE